jgi:hypothetical protein
MPEAKKGRGRPTKYNAAVADRICEQIAIGRSVREICRADDMPVMSTVFQWLAVHKEFTEQYTHAREAQADYLAEELLEIADDGSNDWMERRGENGEVIATVPDHEHISRSKLRVDTRKWIMSKLMPKKYGDMLRQEITGKDGAAIRIIGGLPDTE